ncbi:MAG: response regulator [Acidobacteria bacterium]|nr:response regulator [Acidobacteriota bacterium]MDA1234889.1 response regulator [Acidobacteriota bacterium]
MADKTILCVDDSPTALLSMTNALTGVGYKVITAADGEEALLKALETSPDLVLLDVVLPKRNGFQVCRLLKSSPATKDIKIFLVTSKTQDADRYWGIRQGADAYLTKPFDTQDLLRVVEEHLL